MIVGGAQRRRVPDAQLLLPMPQLGVILLHLQPLDLQRIHHIVNNILRESHSDAVVVQRFVHRYKAVAVLTRQIPLRFHCCPESNAHCGGARQRPFQKIPRAGVPGLPVGAYQIRQHQGPFGRIRQDGKSVGVGYQPHLPHRPHSRHRQQPVQIGHRLHRRGQPDARIQPFRQPRQVRRLAPDDAAVVAVEKRRQLHAGVLRPPDDFIMVHISLARCVCGAIYSTMRRPGLTPDPPAPKSRAAGAALYNSRNGPPSGFARNNGEYNHRLKELRSYD